MKKEILKIAGAALALVLILSLVVALVPAAPASEVQAGAAKWTKFPTPRPGSLNSYLLVPPNQVYAAGPGPIEKAIDGTLYAYWNVGEGAAKGSNVYKSTDDGRSWTICSSTTDELGAQPIIAIACSTEDPSVLYVASSASLAGGVNRIWKSINAGKSFTAVADIAMTYAGTENISCLDVGFSGGNYFLVAGTDNSSVYAPGGNVYVRTDTYGGTWNAQGIDDPAGGAVNVRGVACSPNFATEGSPQIVVVADNGTGLGAGAAFVIYQYAGGDWIHHNELRYNSAPGVTSRFTLLGSANVTTADIAFPADYDSRTAYRDFWVGVSTDNCSGGDVYHIVTTSPALDQNIAGVQRTANVTSLAVGGSTGATMQLAGCADEVNVYHSEDDSATWFASKYDPSGAGFTGYVVMADDYYDSGRAWVATSGNQCALSQTTNFGVSWTQISLINTYLNTIQNISLSPNYAEDSTLFMVTENTSTSDSLWRNDGTYWERVADNITLGAFMSRLSSVQVSPDFTTSNAVFLFDTATPRIWRATDGGFWFKKQAQTPTYQAGGGWLAVNSSTLIIGRTAAGGMHRSTNNGASWSSKTATGAAIATTFSISPDYANDDTLLMGDSADGVFRSTDTGSTWKQIPAGVDVAAGAGTCYVAFDVDYANNSTVYTAGAGTDDVYRLVVGTDTSWKRIDSGTSTSWPAASTAGAAITGIAAGNGALYVADQGIGAVGAVTTDDSGTITVTIPAAGALGDATANVTGAATLAGVAADVTFPVGTTTIFWTAGTGDTILVQAIAAANITGTWTRTGTSTAAITLDADGDAFVTPTGGAFSLPDATDNLTITGSTVTTGATSPTARAVLRAINPTANVVSPYGPFFEAMNKEWTAGANTGIRRTTSADGNNMLWTVKTDNAIWTYEDTATTAPTLTSPKDGFSTGRATIADLSWVKVPSATKYYVWYALDSSFKINKVQVAGGSTAAARITGLESGKTYYWKVSVWDAKPSLSPWSEVRSLTTGIGAAEWNPFSNADGVAPAAGVSGVQLMPVFQWNAADWADSFELQIGTKPDLGKDGYLSTVLVNKIKGTALSSTVWASDIELDYATTYYWQVRAVSATSKSVWGRGAFTTIETAAVPVTPLAPTVIPAPKVEITIPPALPAPAPAPILPAVYVWTIVGIGAALVIAVIILIVRTRRIP